MKRFWICLAVLAMVVGLLATGCGGKQASKDDQKQAAPSGEQGSGGEKKAEANNDLASFKDQTVTFIVATSPGGGYDTYARLIQPHLQKQLPGSTVIIKNVPGAGQMIGTNEVYQAKPDGLTIGIINKGLMSGQLAGLEGIRFDFNKFTWLGNAVSEPRVMVVGKQFPYKTIQDFINAKDKVWLSSTGPGSSADTDARMIKQILEIKNMDLVGGFPGTNEQDLAMLRGEVAGRIGSFESVGKLIENGDAVPLLVVGDKRLKELPDVPLLSEVAPAEAKSLVDFQTAMALLSRPITAPPGLTPSMTKTLRDAMKKAFEDPDMKVKAETAKIAVEFTDGETTQKLVQEAINQPPDVVEFLKSVMTEEKKK